MKLGAELSEIDQALELHTSELERFLDFTIHMPICVFAPCCSDHFFVDELPTDIFWRNYAEASASELLTLERPFGAVSIGVHPFFQMPEVGQSCARRAEINCNNLFSGCPQIFADRSGVCFIDLMICDNLSLNKLIFKISQSRNIVCSINELNLSENSKAFFVRGVKLF